MFILKLELYFIKMYNGYSQQTRNYLSYFCFKITKLHVIKLSFQVANAAAEADAKTKECKRSVEKLQGELHFKVCIQLVIE